MARLFQAPCDPFQRLLPLSLLSLVQLPKIPKGLSRVHRAAWRERRSFVWTAGRTDPLRHTRIRRAAEQSDVTHRKAKAIAFPRSFVGLRELLKAFPLAIPTSSKDSPFHHRTDSPLERDKGRLPAAIAERPTGE
jgi:hypothetical protein